MVTRRHLLLVLSGLLLAVLSGLLWQFRFERSAPAANLRIGTDTRGWVLHSPERFKIDRDTWTLSPPDRPAVASAEGLLPGLAKQRFLHVAMDATWENVTRKDERSWWSARVSLGGRQPDGTCSWPQDGDLINASGSRGWHRVECVFDLPPDIGEPRLFINNLAATGSLSVRRLTVTPVRERPWIPAATVILVLAWLVWTAAMLDRKHGVPRQAASSLVFVAAGWFLVFPQLHFHPRPFPGGFLLGREIPALPESISPAMPVAPPLAQVEVPPALAASKASPPPPESRPDHGLARLFRRVDHDWRFAHVAAFCGVGLALFTLAGLRNAWHLAVLLASLSEVVPNLQLQDFEADDAVDLIANFAGLGLAAGRVLTAARIGSHPARRES